jgi:hypothetical protein
LPMRQLLPVPHAVFAMSLSALLVIITRPYEQDDDELTR